MHSHDGFPNLSTAIGHSDWLESRNTLQQYSPCWHSQYFVVHKANSFNILHRWFLSMYSCLPRVLHYHKYPHSLKRTDWKHKDLQQLCVLIHFPGLFRKKYGCMYACNHASWIMNLCLLSRQNPTTHTLAVCWHHGSRSSSKQEDNSHFWCDTPSVYEPWRRITTHISQTHDWIRKPCKFFNKNLKLPDFSREYGSNRPMWAHNGVVFHCMACNKRNYNPTMSKSFKQGWCGKGRHLKGWFCCTATRVNTKFAFCTE